VSNQDDTSSLVNGVSPLSPSPLRWTVSDKRIEKCSVEFLLVVFKMLFDATAIAFVSIDVVDVLGDVYFNVFSGTV